jgi:hypothetical protein
LCAKLIFEEFSTVQLDIYVAVSRRPVASNWSVYAWSWHWYGSPGPLRKEDCEPNQAPYRALRWLYMVLQWLYGSRTGTVATGAKSLVVS